MRRQIIYSKEFDLSVEALGGYRSVDRAIDTIVEALERNPYAFPHYQNDFIGFRYVILHPIDDLPSVVIVFRIDENKNVVLEHVEENISY